MLIVYGNNAQACSQRRRPEQPVRVDLRDFNVLLIPFIHGSQRDPQTRILRRFVHGRANVHRFASLPPNDAGFDVVHLAQRSCGRRSRHAPQAIGDVRERDASGRDVWSRGRRQQQRNENAEVGDQSTGCLGGCAGAWNVVDLHNVIPCSDERIGPQRAGFFGYAELQAPVLRFEVDSQALIRLRLENGEGGLVGIAVRNFREDGHVVIVDSTDDVSRLLRRQ
mmetsp:Transcript_18568/g.53022  ORF Transcript_18568/g.53022 Transcript_18568/m.53022 type:complete len:223 (-) Transcript_18568:734-1402(-)